MTTTSDLLRALPTAESGAAHEGGVLARQPGFLVGPIEIGHAVFLVDGSGIVRRRNFLAEEVLREEQIFFVRAGLLVPFDESDLPKFRRVLGEVARHHMSRIVVLQGKFTHLAVGISHRNGSDLAVHVQTGLSISEEALHVYSDSVGITSSEREVLRLVLQGLRPAAIAQAKSRTEATVRSHIKNCLAKSGCSSVQELIALVSRLPAFL